ncbi:MAG: hypothetical protein HYT13_01040 [Candidatus Liptonbacteria bacterium]|nr:hypothetical protein [Candidatus Liptonbacteria bacterium]
MSRDVDFKIAIVLSVIAFLGVLLVYFAFAQAAPADEFASVEAQAESAGITFPVPELGNCIDEKTCRAYCDEPTNMPACIKFAEEHGLMNKTEAERAKKFSRVLQVGGPGGCNTPEGCKSFCSEINNLEACLKWADQNNFEDEHFKEAKKIQSYLASGGKMPGSCNSKESCISYCGDFSHAEECFNFAKTAGLTQGPPSEIPRPGEVRRFEDRIPSEEQFKKLKELSDRGETPGGCKSKEACEAYCGESGHFEECLAFGEKVGFIKSDEAQKIREFGGKGPGGCSSPRACESYCNDPSHQEECFKFGEEHGLIPKEELERAKQGFVRLRAGLEQAPPEVTECLKTSLGPNIIEDIQSGKLVPGPQIGERVRECFERFGRRHDPQEVFKNAPPQVISCLKEKLGDDFEKARSGKLEPTPQMADTFRVCFESLRIQGGFVGPGGPPPQAIQGFIRSAPPGVSECLKAKLGDDFQKIEIGELQLTPEIGEKMKACFQEFRPGEQMMRPEVGPQLEGLRILENAPPEVLACLKNSLGEDILEKARSGVLPGSEIAEKMKACFGTQNVPQGGTQPSFPSGVAPSLSPNFPPLVSECLKARLTEEQVKALSFGSQPSPEVQVVIKECFSRVTSPPQFSPISPTEPLPIQPPPTDTFSPIEGGCFDVTSCTKVCSDANSPYYTTDKCVQFRSFQSQPPPGASLLETLLAPFLNFLGR